MTDTSLQQTLRALHPSLANCIVAFTLSGTANNVAKVRSGRQSLAVRRMSPVRDAATPRSVEREIWLTLHQQSIAPELLHWDSVHQFCISKWIDADGAPSSAQLVPLLVTLHTSPAPDSCPQIDILQGIRFYLDELAIPVSDFLPHFQQLLATLELSQLNTGLCHNDLVAGNLINDGSQLWLIDFEYSGINHPYFDVCSAWMTFVDPKESLNDFAKAYLTAIEREFNETEHQALASAYELSLWLGLLWAAAKQPDWRSQYEQRLNKIDHPVTQWLLVQLGQ
ncbi:phosphotransferase [uncultured Umboniibacter sp.]|uniref:phosphotransferase n=1 Tax=uncultured Umboniibacter sp. TaxID=1798917 RepID=UPI0026153860|nr:phosphotransferase [uncultured Umboniibacter sp.]